MIEVFSGAGRLTSAVKELGLPCFPIDIKNDPNDDMLVAKNRCHLYNIIRSGRVYFIWISMPCAFYSNACKPGEENLHPHANNGRSGGSLRRLRAQAELLKFSASLIELCRLSSVPWAFENPWSSRC